MDLIDNKLVVTSEYEWKLKREELTVGKYCLSKVFDIQLDKISTKWEIVVFYHGSNTNMYAYLSKIASSSNDFEVNYSLFTNALKHRTDAPKIKEKTSNGALINGEWIFLGSYSSVFGHSGYDHTYMFNSFDLTLKISLKEVPAKTEYPTAFWTDNEGLLNSDHLSDFTFVCSDKTAIPAHRFILAFHSPVLRTMLNTEMIESKKQMTKLDDIDGETMMEFLRFLYAGKVEKIQEFAPKLLYCAEKYEVAILKELCAQEMIRNLSVDNVIEYLTLSHRLNEQDLALRCILFIKRNYEAVCQKEIGDIDSLKFNLALSTHIGDNNISSIITIGTSQTSVQALSSVYMMFP